MKKFILILLSLILATVGLIGCGKKPMDPVKATEAFIDRFVFNQSSENFTNAFANSSQYEELANTQLADFKDAINSSLLGQGTSINDTQAQQLYDAFISAMKEKTSYTVTLVEGNDKEATVKVSITGLDFVGIISPYFKSIMAEAAANPTAFTDTAKATELAFTKLQESLKTIQPAATAQEVELTLIADSKDPSKWVLDTSNSADLSKIFMAFFYGETDMSTFTSKIKDVMTQELKALGIN